MKAIIVDDHPIARYGLRAVVTATFEVERIVEVDGGAKAIGAAKALDPDLVLMDLDLPQHPHGPTLCGQLRAVAPRARIVIVTAFARTPDIRQCLVAGAHGCLLKDTSNVDLSGSLRAIVAGETIIDPRIAQRIASDAIGVLRGDAPVVRLSKRQRQVLGLLAEGCSNQVIAERLSIAEATVKDHVGAVMAKLDATSRLHAVVRASEEGLL